MRIIRNLLTLLTLVSASASASAPGGLSFSSALSQPNDCDHTVNKFSCVEFLYNYDGDTITVRVPSVHPLIGEKISVRIAGVDTPELISDDPCERAVARASRKFVRGLLLQASRIDLHDLKRDKYFRILADVIADGVSVGEMLLAHGLAYPYDGRRKEFVDWCEKSNEQFSPES